VQGLALSLVLLSAVFHAAWNVLAKGLEEQEQGLGALVYVTGLWALPVAIAGQLCAVALPPLALVLCGLSGLCCAVYFFSLGRAYARADFTVVYPIARSLPVLLVGLGDVLRGVRPSGAGWAGMLLVVVGCVLAPQRGLRCLSLRAYCGNALVWVALTALGTVGYSLLDKMAAELVPPGPAAALLYCCFFYAFTALGYAILVRSARPLRGAAEGHGLGRPALMGVLSFSGYFLVLWAYQLVPQASYVVAFRQSSLVIGVLLAFALYRGERLPIRLAAVLIITAGLVLVSLYG